MLQAEGIRYGVEHWRRHMDRVRGTIYWQLNDCWPVASWSSLDSFGRWKALHYVTRRYYAPVLLSVEDKGTQMSLHVTSDLQQPWQGAVRWSLESVDGAVVLQGEEAVTAQALADTLVRTLDFAAQVTDANSRQLVFVYELWQAGTRLTGSVATFAPNKHVALVNPGLTTVVHGKDNQVEIEVTAQSLARHVELTLDGADVVFSDNYFDVPAGRTRTVTGTLPMGWSVEQARAALQVRSLYDTYTG
jgi:beta-mannosidase